MSLFYGYTVLVTGSRKWPVKYKKVIWDVLDREMPNVIIHGGAVGPDTFAHQWCKKRGRTSIVYFPDWAQGKGAALSRNLLMVEENYQYIDKVFAFPYQEARGTMNQIQIAKDRDIQVKVFTVD